MTYPSTPIHIIDDVVYAWVWNGRERSGGMPKQRLPVFRLKRPPLGGWRNGRILTLPYHRHYTQMMEHPR